MTCSAFHRVGRWSIGAALIHASDHGPLICAHLVCQLMKAAVLLTQGNDLFARLGNRLPREPQTNELSDRQQMGAANHRLRIV